MGITTHTWLINDKKNLKKNLTIEACLASTVRGSGVCHFSVVALVHLSPKSTQR